jgi:hypothetical protein
MSSNSKQIEEVLTSDNQNNIDKVKASIEAQKDVIRNTITQNNITGEQLKEYILGTIKICQANGTSDIALQELATEFSINPK